MDLKLIALIVTTLVFLYSMALHYLKSLSVSRPVPAAVRDVYDAAGYDKWKRYRGEKSRLDLVSTAVRFAAEFLLLALNAYAAFAGLFGDNFYLQLFAVTLLMALVTLLDIPFSYYDTMVLEEKYGFNRSTKKTFFLDQVKSLLIELVLDTGLAALLCRVHQAMGDHMAILFAALLMLLVLLISFLFPFLSKLFNKFTPLEEGELRRRLSALLEKNGYHVRDIKVMDASRRTTRSNAYFTGFGKTKTVVLYDTLLKAMTDDEICAVFAHEMGHGLHRDTLKNQVLSFVQMAVIALLAWLTVRTPAVFTAFGFSAVNYGFALLLIMSVGFALISPVFSLIMNAHSRRAEYRADAQAVKEGCGAALTSALKKLAKENLSDLSPHPLLVRLEYSHPPLDKRIEAIERQMNK